MALIVIISLIAIAQGVISLIAGQNSLRHIRSYRPYSLRRPRVVVFCPCKGVDAGFQANIKSILNQHYPHFRPVFIVDSDSDPAAAVLSHQGATVLVAGRASDRGQKVHNLTYGVEQAAGDAEVLVFCDADARFPDDWLIKLIAPLDDADVGVSTGYRWYAAESGTLPGLLRSSWNASVVTMLGDHRDNFAWGGSMAMRRDAFDAMKVLKAWQGVVSDDYAVTRAARSVRKRIVFVPECLIPSYGDCSWRELLEFTTRQIVITRVYDPPVWRLAIITYSVFNVAFWFGILVSWSFLWVTLTLFALSGIKSYLRYSSVKTVLPDEALSKRRASYILLAPVTALLFEYNLVQSAFTRSITWRQIRYRLISHDRTEVYPGDAAS